MSEEEIVSVISSDGQERIVSLLSLTDKKIVVDDDGEVKNLNRIQENKGDKTWRLKND